jgi:2-polyprenyl-3-methyl-5-hydroxy-6-metoxy-1,4-benzoquinol methylase
MKLRCTQCGGHLHIRENECECAQCARTYRAPDGIVILQERANTDLRIGTELLDIHDLVHRRRYFGATIESNVEYHARVHSVQFVDFHVELLRPHLEAATVLDLGCGQLTYANIVPQSTVRALYGIDLSLESLRIAKRNFAGHYPLTLAQHGVLNVPCESGAFDAVISSEVLEHLDDPMQHLHEAHRLCRSGGFFSLSTPCSSMYLYPHNFLLLLRHPLGGRIWLKKLNAHRHWREALTWHPALRPSVLRAWLGAAGFEVVRHETRLWYYHTPLRIMWRLFSLLERMGMRSAGAIFRRYLAATDKLLSLNVPVLKWAGIRQFVLCRKP